MLVDSRSGRQQDNFQLFLVFDSLLKIVQKVSANLQKCKIFLLLATANTSFKGALDFVLSVSVEDK